MTSYRPFDLISDLAPSPLSDPYRIFRTPEGGARSAAQACVRTPTRSGGCGVVPEMGNRLTLNRVWGPRAQGEDGGEPSQSHSGHVSAALGMLAMVGCCGLLLLLVAAGGLASVSVITARYTLLYASAAIAVLLLVAVGIAVRSSRSRKKSRQTKTKGDACC